MEDFIQFKRDNINIVMERDEIKDKLLELQNEHSKLKSKFEVLEKSISEMGSSNANLLNLVKTLNLKVTE
eukprot:CAMPEP_0116908118 /NCGR_PEP_ID=MMETSP0467-20121206/13508_1 /TAXON_ID=283647 /ORGANISM="Mesodinium pulex, Strain SPMC105" /LENGTH=69 /DNA_ID=CAMNT_0004583261 /DNA_START=1479 /DNA_END=1688 /DNA_ORIENTATION=-